MINLQTRKMVVFLINLINNDNLELVMKKVIVFIGSILLIGCSTMPSNKDSLQSKIDSLEIGITDIDKIRSLFGEPEIIGKKVDWYEGYSKNIRSSYTIKYPSKGLSFSLLSNPSELLNIRITSDNVNLDGFFINDTLQNLESRFEDSGQWYTTDAQNLWWLEFWKDGHRIKFGFSREMNNEKYPMKLANPKLIKEIILINDVQFVGKYASCEKKCFRSK